MNSPQFCCWKVRFRYMIVIILAFALKIYGEQKKNVRRTEYFFTKKFLIWKVDCCIPYWKIIFITCGISILSIFQSFTVSLCVNTTKIHMSLYIDIRSSGILQGLWEARARAYTHTQTHINFKIIVVTLTQFCITRILVNDSLIPLKQINSRYYLH